MSTPRSAAAAPGWGRLVLASLWLVPVLFGRGGFAWIGFLIVGISARRASWMAAAGVWAVVGLVLLADWGQWQGVVQMIAWVGSIVHALIIQQSYLRMIAAESGGGADTGTWHRRPETAQERRTRTQRSNRSSRSSRATGRSGTAASVAPAAEASAVVEDAARERASLVADTPAAPAARETARETAREARDSPPAAKVDVNTASRRELQKLPGMTVARAKEAIAERDRRDGFSDLDEFAAALALQPHEFARLRPAAFCSPRPRPRSYGRRLDL